MSPWDQYYEQDERDDQEHAFEVQRSDCGKLYSNLDGDCPNCASANCSYDSRGAARWNEHMRRTGR